jgi:putative ABC transport system ATP-binding protein
MIAVRNLSYSYSSQSLKAKEIIFPDFQVERGEQFLLLGESGSGKTTLLHLLGGLLRPQKGKVMIDKVEINQLSELELDHFRGSRVGFIFQKNHLITSLSVKNNLLMAPFLAGEKQDTDRVEGVLKQLGLFEKRNTKVHELSQGQAQRVAIARAIINRPALILADEPTSSLDDTNCAKVMELLHQLAIENNAALIIATHDQRLKDKIRKQIAIE